MARFVRALLLVGGLLLALACPALAQTTPAWQSALALTHTTASGTAVTRATAVDAASGAVFVTGTFTGQVAFGSTILNTAGSSDVFVARYEPATATWAWAKSAGGSNSDAGLGIAADGQGGVYVTGNFVTSATIAGQALSGSGTEVFVAAYAATDGTGRWAKSAGGNSADIGQGIATNGTNVYVTGYFTTSATFFAGETGVTTLSGNGGEVFVAAYTASAGAGVWAKRAGSGVGSDEGRGVATDGTNVYVTGYTFSNPTFFAGEAGATTISVSGQAAFVAAYAAGTGTGVWVKSANGPNADQGYGIATNGTNVYVTGYFNASATFFAGQPAATTLSGTGNQVFVAAYAATDGAGVWAKSDGGPNSDLGRGIATDGTTVYVTGDFTTSATFFAGQPAATTLTGLGQEVFVAAYAATDGTGVWAKSGGGSGNDISYGVAVGSAGVYVGSGTGTGVALFGNTTVPPSAAVLGTLSKTTGAWQAAAASMTAAGTSQVLATAVDKVSGVVFVTGSFTGQVAFGSTILTSAGNSDVFVACYAPATATWAWAKSAGGSNNDAGQGIATDGTNVYVTGYFTASATFFGGQTPAAPVTLTGGGFDVFVAAYAAGAGTGVWAKKAGGSDSDVGYGIATDGTNVYVTGTFGRSATFFGGQPAATTLTGTGFEEVFVAAYVAGTGTGVWAKSAGGSDSDSGYGIATDGTNVYVTGYFATSATFFGGQTPAAPVTLTSTGNEVFVAAYAAGTGTGVWAKSAGSNGAQGNSIATDGTNVYVTGAFNGSATFFGGQTPAAPVTLTGTGGEVFVAAYAAGAGTGVWAKSAGGSSGDAGQGIATDGTNVYVTGYFTASATFFGGQTPAAPVALTGTGVDLFVAAYAAGAGTGLWAKSAGGSDFDRGRGVATDGSRVFVGGFVGLPATFGAITLPGTTTPVGVLAGLTLLPTLASLSATSGAAGSSLGATGGALGGATAVTFTPASGPATNAASGYSSTSTTVSGIVVPAGLAAGTYTVTVTTAGGTSNGLAFTVTSAGPLVVSTGTLAAPTAIAAGTYTTIAVTGTGVGRLAGAVVVNDGVDVQAGGVLLTACQALTGAGSFTLAAGATLGICDAAGIAASGNSGAVQLAGTRSFSTDASYLYNGTVAQATGAGLPATVRSLAVNNAAGATLTQATAVTQTVVLTSGNLASNGRLTLRSVHGAGTALVDNSGGAVTGSSTMQRAVDIFTPTNDGYHHYSSPVANTTAGDLAAPGFAPVFNGVVYNAAALAGQVRPFPTVFGYDETRVGSTSVATDQQPFEQGYFAPADASTPLAVGKGYTALVPNAVLVDFVGTLNNAPVGSPLVVSGLTRGANAQSGWQLLGNPFPAPLDWSGVTTTGLDAAMYVYHATSTYSGYYSTYLGTPNGTTIAGSPIVDAGQGFFVRTTTAGTPGTVSFANANRITTFGAQPAFGRSASTAPTVALALTGAAGTDALTIYADAAATTGLDAQYDAVKLANPSGLNLAAVSATGTLLAIDGRPTLATAQRIPLRVTVPTTGTYTLSAATLAHLPATTAVVLTDALTGTTTDLRRTASYRFTATATAPTTGRFFLNLTPAGTALATAGAALAEQVQVYPNPVSSAFALLLPAGTAATTATLVNSLGQTVRRFTATAATTVDVAGLAAGVYTLRLTLAGQPITKRVVVE